jgi:hypothetical protein
MGNFLQPKEYWLIVEFENKYSFVRCSKLKYLKAKNYLFHVIDCPFLEIILGKDFQ